MSPDEHDVSLFDYDLPDELIADGPLPDRSGSRLLVVDRRTGGLTHAVFSRIGSWIGEGDLLLVNNAKVVPARLYGHKDTGGKVEVFLVRQQSDDPSAPPWPGPGESGASRWIVLLSPSSRLREGQRLHFGGSPLRCDLGARRADGSWTVQFGGAPNLAAEFQRIGEAPLPPYILRARKARGAPEADAADRSAYQTVYASVPGAVAAPTAGLHFTPAVLSELADKGVRTAEITLLVGPGTFKPVKVQDLTHHVLDPEFYIFPEPARNAVRAALAEGRRVVAVGTTSCRVVEYVAANDLWDEETGWTDLYVYPPYEFRAVGALVTNFHLPRSTLLMLVSAFAGRELVMRAYAEAIRERYRFYSYGDAMMVV